MRRVVIRTTNPRDGRGGVLLVAERQSERMRGLRATGPLPQGHMLLLPHTRTIHTFGLRATIEVVYVDPRMEVIAVRRVRPGRVAGPVRGARHVIEASETTGLRAGDALQLVGAPSEAEPTSRAYFASAPVV